MLGDRAFGSRTGGGRAHGPDELAVGWNVIRRRSPA